MVILEVLVVAVVLLLALVLEALELLHKDSLVVMAHLVNRAVAVVLVQLVLPQYHIQAMVLVALVQPHLLVAVVLPMQEAVEAQGLLEALEVLVVVELAAHPTEPLELLI